MQLISNSFQLAVLPSGKQILITYLEITTDLLSASCVAYQSIWSYLMSYLSFFHDLNLYFQVTCESLQQAFQRQGLLKEIAENGKRKLTACLSKTPRVSVAAGGWEG